MAKWVSQLSNDGFLQLGDWIIYHFVKFLLMVANNIQSFLPINIISDVVCPSRRQ